MKGSVMIFATNPISASLPKIASTSINKVQSYKQSQTCAIEIATVVFESLLYLTESNNSLNLESLKNLQQVMENENLSQFSAYGVVKNLVMKFEQISGDGNVITKDDFLATIKFSVSQSFAKDKEFMSLVAKNANMTFSDTIKNVIGVSNLQVVDVIRFLDNISNETISNTISSINRYSNNEDKVFFDKEESSFAKNEFQDYRTIEKSQLNFPINISI